MLSTASNIDVDQLNISVATDISDQTADTDQFLVYDSSASAMKKVSGTNLKSYVGSSGLSAGNINNSNLFTANAVDTNGAGDMFAGGVIHGLSEGWENAVSVEFGTFLASKGVAEIGPRLKKNKYKEYLKEFSKK